MKLKVHQNVFKKDTFEPDPKCEFTQAIFKAFKLETASIEDLQKLLSQRIELKFEEHPEPATSGLSYIEGVGIYWRNSYKNTYYGLPVAPASKEYFCGKGYQASKPLKIIERLRYRTPSRSAVEND